MGKRTKKNEVLGAIVGGSLLVLLLGGIVTMLWWGLGGYRSEGLSHDASQYVETTTTPSRSKPRPPAFTPSEAEQKAAAAQVPLAKIDGAASPAPQPKPAATTQPTLPATAKPATASRSAPIPLATLGRASAPADKPIETSRAAKPLTPVDAPKPAQLAALPATQPTAPAAAAELPTVELSSLKRQMSPPAEADRLRAEKLVTPDQDTVKIVTGFECSTPLEIEKISPTHFSVRLTTDSELKNWFMFRVEGAKGKTIRIDISDSPVEKWWSLNPVYSYASSVDDPGTFTATPVPNPAEPVASYNGPLLPDTSGQKWRFMPTVWTEQTGVQGEAGKIKTPVGRLSTVQTFDEDSAYVALKVPYTAKYNQAYVDSLRSNPNVTVIDVGESVGNRPLHILRIGTGDPKQVPCIVLYAREHGSEHDSSWVVQGAIEHILRNTEEGKRLREQFTFLILPMLDPDAVAASKYENIIKHFVYTGRSGPESLRIADYFRKWVEAGNRLDIVYNIHNVESAECGHLLSVVKDRGPERGPASWSLDEDFLRPLTQNTVYRLEPRTQLQGEIARFRLGGYLGFFYGPLHMPYEVNSQDKVRHLTLEELRGIGPLIIQSGTEFLPSEKATPLKAVIAEMRRQRDERVARFSHLFRNLENPLQVEWVSYEKQAESKLKGKQP